MDLSQSDFMASLAQIKIVRPPRHVIATFGTTTLQYHVVSEMASASTQTRLRSGRVTAQKPQILTPVQLREHFEGFGDNSDILAREMESLYGEQLKGLGYVFRNELQKETIEHSSAAELLERMTRHLEESNPPREALIQAPESAWHLAVMKFIIDTSLRSFRSNVKELDERGFFDPAGREQAARKRHIERLFQEARANNSARHTLAEKLKEWGLFPEYEDRFFALF